MQSQTGNLNKHYISEFNKHIEEYLDYYCNLTSSPQFAILLKGQWGCGKSWFINQYKKKVKTKEKKPLYVSLYGINSFSQIEDTLFLQTNPIFASKQAKIGEKIIKGLLSKWVINFDFDRDQKPDGNVQPSLSEISIKDFLKSPIQDDSKYNLLIFDDLERCSIDIEDILGYINNFIESEYLKVVILADEDKISKQKKYKKIKEKIIRKTFEISPDFQGALNSFLTKINNDEVKKSLLSNYCLIEDLFSKGQCKNLRTLSQVILDFERIFQELPEKAKNCSELIREVLEILIIFSIEISQANLHSSDIIKIPEKIDEELLSSVQAKINLSNNLHEIKTQNVISFIQIFNKYGFNPRYKLNILYPNLSWWQDFFNKGVVDKSILEESLPNSKYFQAENTEKWIKLWYYTRLTDQEFKKILHEVDSEYADRKFEDLGIIKHITGLFLLFSEAGIYEKKVDDVLSEAKKYIDYLKASGKLDSRYKDIGSYMNLSFVAQGIPQFKELEEYILETQEKARIYNIQKEVEDLLNIMQSDISKFYSMICISALSNSDISERKYHEFPIFQYVDSKDFIQKILTMNNQDKNEVFSSLLERYKFQEIAKELTVEIDFLKEIQELLLEQIEEKKGEISGYILKKVNDDYLQKAITILEESKLH